MSYDLFVDGPLKGKWMEIRDNEYAITAATSTNGRVHYHRSTVVANWPVLFENGATVVINDEFEMPMWCNELHVWSTGEPRADVLDWDEWRAKQ